MYPAAKTLTEFLNIVTNKKSKTYMFNAQNHSIRS